MGDIFASREEFFLSYLAGCPGHRAREQEAIAVSAIALFMEDPGIITEAMELCDSPAHFARLAYACLIAESRSSGEKRQRLACISREALRRVQPDTDFPLFCNIVSWNRQRGAEAEKAHIYGGLCRGDIGRMLISP